MLFPQERWMLLVASSPFLAYFTYRMKGENSYMWFMAGNLEGLDRREDAETAIKVVEAYQRKNTRAKRDKTYHLVISLHPDDRSLSERELEVVVRRALRAAGLEEHQFIAMTREDWMFAQDILTTEFSAVDQAFAVGTSDGLQAFYGRDRGRMWFALSNGVAGGKEDFPNNTTSQALLSARGEVQLLGDDWNTFNDLVGRKGRSLGVLLGVGSGYAVTGPNAAVATPRHQGQVTVDLSVGGDGFQVMAYGMWNWQAVGTAQSTWGFVAQAGYFILEPWQVYALYSLVHPGKLAGLVPFNALTLGTSLFPFDWTNRIKLSLEGALLFNTINSTLVASNPQNGWLPADAGNQYSLRAQLQFGF